MAGATSNSDEPIAMRPMGNESDLWLVYAGYSRMLMSRGRTFCVVSLLVALVAPLRAQVRSTIIGPGETQVPIAVSPLKVSGGAGDVGVGFADHVVRDLELSGMFRVVPRNTYISQPSTSGVELETVRFENWSVLGAHTLVKGLLTQNAGDIVVEARLFDVAQRSQLMGRRYAGRLEDLERIADRFADEIIGEVSGRRGPFDSKIAFLSNRGGRFKDVYVMRANGQGMQRLTSKRTLNLAPRWGPLVDRLTLTSYSEGDPEVFSIDYPTGTWRRMSRLRGLNLGGGWSPDGGTLLTTMEYGGNSEIVTLGSDGTVGRRLTNHAAIDVSPSWSADGSQIAFCSNRAGSPQIYIMGAGGGRPRRLTRHGSYNTSPAWSPESDRIAYASRVKGRFQIFVVNSDGSGVHQVTTRGNNENPSWSPDGRYLVFSSSTGGAAKLALADISGAHVVQLTQGKGNDTSPTWSTWLD